VESGRRRCRALPLVLLLAACAGHVQPSPSAAAPAPSNAAGAPWCAAEVSGTSESAQFGVAGPLAELNTQFREAHARARSRECAELETNRLVLRYSFGLFEARFRGREIARTFVVPAAYHPIKDVSHAVFLAALLLAEPASVARDQAIASTLDALARALADLRNASSATASLVPSVLQPRETRLLERTRQALVGFANGQLDPAAQKAYFASVRGDLEDNLRDIAAESLKALHAAVESTRAKVTRIDPKAWDSALVVIGVVHQARAREIGIQYFERLLREPVGEGARNERRMVVAEGFFHSADQYGLLSAHLVDQTGGAVIFEDPLRMQWDVLGEDHGVLEALLPR
jgi:hypothetical protein